MKMERNTELFFAVAEQIEKDPDGYYQQKWCGTRKCVAGWAVCLADGVQYDSVSDLEAAHNDGWVLAIAAELLGLEFTDADALFDLYWKPHDGLSVPDALRKIGKGASIEDVSA